MFVIGKSEQHVYIYTVYRDLVASNKTHVVGENNVHEDVDADSIDAQYLSRILVTIVLFFLLLRL